MPAAASSRSENVSSPWPISPGRPRWVQVRSLGGDSGNGTAATRKNFSSAPIQRTLPTFSTVSFASFSTGVRSTLSPT